MKILLECSLFEDWQIKKIEEHYKGKYILETCLKNKDGGWANFPAAIFYQKDPPPNSDFSNYFAMWKHPITNRLTISNGLKSVEEEFEGILIDDVIAYSHYRHDCREVEGKGVFVDGGRDYLRYGGERFEDIKPIKFKVVDDDVRIILEKLYNTKKKD